MAKKFKPKKKIHIPKIIIYGLIIILFYLFYKWVSNLSINKVNNDFLKYLNSYYHYFSYNGDKNNNPIISIFKKDINNPKQLLVNDLVYNSPKKEKKKIVYSSKKDEEPVVYIYNTHQNESYNMTYVEDYNVVPNVLLMSHIMQERLNNLGICTIVEENNITEYLNSHNLDYSKSYQVSQIFLADILEKYNNLKLIIDLHRDAASYEATTVDIDNKKYAKIMFVLGKENPNYSANLSVMNRLNEIINSKYPQISRGILEKEGKGVNGVYNQNMNKSIILLELGGDKNNIDELINTLDILVSVIKEYLDEKE